MKKIFSWQNPVFGAVLLILLMSILQYLGLQYKIEWLVNAVPAISSALATLLVGLYAFTLYKKQKDDIKKDAANILLLELQNAEKVLKLAQRSLEKTPADIPYDAITMPTESWSKNKYLFVTDFDNNEWEAISNFYSACSLFDESVRTNASYFQKNEEQIRVNIQQWSAEIAKDYGARIEKAKTTDAKTKLKAELSVKIAEATDLYLSGVKEYGPVKPVNDAKLCLETIKLNISLPTAISKLKELAK
jgi:hypothetical protein